MGALIRTCWQRPRASIQCLFLTACVFVLYSCADVGNKNSVPLGKAKGSTREKLKEPCAAGDKVCDKERVEYDSITALHRQIDDDHSGAIDLSESDEFLREELQYTDGSRHTTFHGDDTHVTSDELWKFWKKSEVHNWTTDDALDWLLVHVELAQYAEAFKQNNVDGAALPRIAVNTNSYMTTVLGIRNPVHKQKLTLKAMDVVLFGPPKKPHSYMKDLILVTSLFVAMAGCWFAYIQHKNAQSHLKKMMSDLDVLQKAEDSLSTLQHQLSKAQEEHKSVREEKLSLEKKMKNEIEETKREAFRLKEQRESTDGEIGRLKLAEEEIDHLRGLLLQAERQLEDNQFLPSSDLQQWLQLTYEIELKHYEQKKVAAEKQLLTAKDGWDKIRKKRGTFLAPFRMAHSGAFDDVDKRITEARAALEEVRYDLQERLHRWRQIEVLCAFPITSNPGLGILEPALRDSCASPPAPSISCAGSQGSVRGSASNLLSIDDADDEMSPPFKVAPSEPAKHGRFYTLGLAAMYATSYRIKARARTKAAQSRHIVPSQTLNPTNAAINSRVSPVKNIPSRFPTNPSSPGLHSMHLGQSDFDRRTLTSARSSDNFLRMTARPDTEHHAEDRVGTAGSTASTPDGPVKFSIDGHENGIHEQPSTSPSSKYVNPTIGHSISIDSALTKNERHLGRPLSLQATRSESLITEGSASRSNTLNGSLGTLRKRVEGSDQPQSLTPPCTPVEENSSEEGSSLDLSDGKKKEKKRKGFSMKFLKKDKTKKT
ncbi:stromal interaction molecule homolog isoform X2 [Lineus longissimus]|uniref:stromal interaction molecule homolog isoform X2 n=1 Tax=Lineus longissimus TaxID=88925 RepID=UPI00315DDD63